MSLDVWSKEQVGRAASCSAIYPLRGRHFRGSVPA
jgi:hypothetical protein